MTGASDGPLSLLEAARAVVDGGAPSNYAARLADLRAAVALVDSYCAAADALGLDAVARAAGAIALAGGPLSVV